MCGTYSTHCFRDFRSSFTTKIAYTQYPTHFNCFNSFISHTSFHICSIYMWYCTMKPSLNTVGRLGVMSLEELGISSYICLNDMTLFNNFKSESIWSGSKLHSFFIPLVTMLSAWFILSLVESFPLLDLGLKHFLAYWQSKDTPSDFA